MAVNPQPTDNLGALTRQAADEIRAVNPHIGQPLPPLIPADASQLLADDAEVDRVFDEFERSGGVITKTIAELVSEDRGE